jgi:hypothetical protein
MTSNQTTPFPPFGNAQAGSFGKEKLRFMTDETAATRSPASRRLVVASRRLSCSRRLTARAILLSVICLLGLCGSARGEVYSPEGGVRHSKGKVDVELIELITDQNVIGRNISTAELAAFIKHAEKSVAQSVPPKAAPFRLHVLVTCSPRAKPTFHLKHDRPVPHDLLQHIYDSLQKLPDTRTKNDSISFKIDFVIKAKA